MLSNDNNKEKNIMSSKVEIKGNTQLTKYIEEFDKDVALTDFNLREKSLTVSSIWAKWISYLYKEKSTLEVIKEKKTLAMKDKVEKNKFNDSILKKKNEDNIEKSDEIIQKLNKLYKITEDNISFIERSLNVLQNFGYQIRTCAEILKLNLK